MRLTKPRVTQSMTYHEQWVSPVSLLRSGSPLNSTRQVAPVPMTYPHQIECAPTPSLLMGTGDTAIAAFTTREAFERRCGKAACVEKRGAPDFDPGTTRLIYPQACGQFRAYFRNDNGQVRAGAVRVFPGAEGHPGLVDRLQALGCGLAP